ncbi:MAG: lecithin retinol acyltransferase family protein [bacterium]
MTKNNNMALARKDKTYKLTELPILSSTRITYNGQIGYTGSLIKRPVKGSAGLYKHTGIVYGCDKNNTMWIIENNVNGVECITLRDFHLGMKYRVELNLNPPMVGIILGRANERANEKYHARDNNCEHFTNYCLHGTLESYQTKNTEAFANVLLSVTELYLATYTSEISFIENYTKLRKQLKIERHESIDKALADMIKKKNVLKSTTDIKAETPKKKTRKKQPTKTTRPKKVE